MQAIIQNALYRNTEINGTFQLIEKCWNSADAAPKTARMKIMLDGKIRTIRVNKEDVQYVDEMSPMSNPVEAFVAPAVTETKDDIAKRITESFEALDIFTTGVIGSHVQSMIVSGAAGVGKTYNIDRDLQKAAAQGVISKYVRLAGRCTGVGLFTKLWECRAAGSVLLLDDVDVFKDEDQVNLLKAACDTGEERWVSWLSASSYFEENGIDQEFEFKGTIVFITNRDFDREIDANTKMSAHFSALISRTIYLDLGVHTKEEIMIRINQVIANTNMMQDIGLNDSQIEVLMTWLDDNLFALRCVSLRTCLHIANMMLTSPTKWEMLAKSTMFSQKRK
ncbi:P-loop containing nucleoside triphosphate hydrolase [Vibrio phage 1.081.O._10N.286.52.C2]|nr:P-loop containing nucleoside triphosphate hydrolase [Vibrio phage 1.081.O._10N.286.52.C2]